jgi:hypothetical protein
MRAPISAIIALGILGCAGQNYAYPPEAANALSPAGPPAARTQIPLERPRGSVEVASYGITDLRSDGIKIPVLQVRMTVRNDSDDGPWLIDTRRQLAQIPGEGRSAPMYVNGDARSLREVPIGRGQRRVIDLYYPLPATIRGDAQLRRFDVLWQVETSERTVASHDTFDRIEVEPEEESADLYQPWPLWSGYGPNWWYDPFYPGTAYIHPRVVGTEHRFPPTGSLEFRGRFRPRPAPATGVTGRGPQG